MNEIKNITFQNISRNNFINNIDYIYDENDKIINFKELTIKFGTNKYSSKKNAIWHLYMVLNDNNIRITKRLKYKFHYRCITCNSKHIIGSTQILRKINKLSINCNFCKNGELEKKEKQSISLHKTLEYKKVNNCQYINKKDKIKLSNIDKIKESVRYFNEMDDDFKENYFNYNLTIEEFNRIKKNIISFQNGKISMSDNIEYIPIFRCNNQICFTSMLYDKNNDIIFKTNQPILKCETCNTNWRAKSLERHKNKYIIRCNECSFVCNSFKIRRYHNINKDVVNYQSKLELKFINFCNNNSIIINNGPKIKYNFNNSNRKHTVDLKFY
jgi:hypothetical protein